MSTSLYDLCDDVYEKIAILPCKTSGRSPHRAGSMMSFLQRLRV